MLTVNQSHHIVSRKADIKVEKDGQNLRRERRLWHDPVQKTPCLGCQTCPDLEICGGLFANASIFDCFQFCCNRPDDCDRVCRCNPTFADRIREVGTFELCTIPRAPILSLPDLPTIVPILYGNNGRADPIDSDTVALSLYQLLNRHSHRLRFTRESELRRHFCLAPDTPILLTGIARDAPLERWWHIGEGPRIDHIRTLKEMGISLVTVPNYSLFTDRPRQDNLYSMKRIATVHEEFLRCELPAALHVNARTERDFERWEKYVCERPEVTHVAYEFTTGTRRVGRREQHALWLAHLASSVSHPLHLIVRGGTEILPILSGSFATITTLNSSIYMKTIKRQKAIVKGNWGLGWVPCPTRKDEPLDGLFEHNRATVGTWYRQAITLCTSCR